MKASGADWKELKLGTVLRYLDERVEMDDDKEYLTITVKRRHGGLEIREKLFGHQIATKKQFRLVPRAFIISRVQCWHQAYAIVGEVPLNTIASTNYDQFAISPEVDPRFFWWLSHRPAFTETVRSSAVGVVIEKMVFNRDQWLTKSVRVPPLSEQRRVVARIEELAAQIHEARTLRHQAAEEAETLVQARRSGLIQQRPRALQTRFEDLVLETQLGIDRSSSQQSPEYPMAYLKMNNITPRGTLELAEITRVNASDEEIAKFTLREGDFLFNTRNSFELVGKTAVWEGADEPFLFNNNIMRILFRYDVDPRFVNAAFVSPVVAEQLLHFKKRTTSVCALYWKNLKEVRVPVPPLPEQRRIVSELDALQAEVDALKRLQAETAAELDALLPSLLDKAFKGEL